MRQLHSVKQVTITSIIGTVQLISK